jgi:hypothetical protein
MWHKLDMLDRFVSFSLTPSMPSPDKVTGTYNVEVWVAAERRKNTLPRKLIWSYVIEEEEVLSGDEGRVTSIMEEGLGRGLDAADAITLTDLTQAHAGPDADRVVA